MKNVLVILAPGFEEVEAIAPVDILRRAGAVVTVAGTIDGPVIGRNNVVITPDETLDRVKTKDFDLIILPGGAAGTENLKKDPRVRELVLRHYNSGRLVSAICAAPTVLSDIGVTKGKTITSHPGVRDKFKDERVLDDAVVVDGNIATSQGPATSIEFALRLVEMLFGKGKADEVAKAIVYPRRA